MLARALVPALLVLLALAGCGRDDADDVREAVASFSAAAKAGDANGVCVRLAPRSRELVERLGRLQTGERPPCRDVVALRADDPGASLSSFEAASEELDVEVDGDRAVVSEQGEPDVGLVRDGDRWTVDVVTIPQVGYRLQASVACGAERLEDARRPLPAATRRGLAREFRASARRLDGTRDALARLRPPEERERDHRAVLEELGRQAQATRRIADGLDGVVSPLRAVEREGRLRVRSERRLTAAQRRLRVACLTPLTGPATQRYREQATRVCGRVARGFDRLEEPQGGAEALRYLDRVAGLGRQALRGLRRLEPPAVAADAHDAALGAYADAVDQLNAQGRLVRQGRDPAGRQLRLELTSLRSTVAFNRLALPTCAQL